MGAEDKLHLNRDSKKHTSAKHNFKYRWMVNKFRSRRVILEKFEFMVSYLCHLSSANNLIYEYFKCQAQELPGNCSQYKGIQINSCSN